MNANSLKELIAFCEKNQLGEVAKGLGDLQKQRNSQQVDALTIIREALVREERKVRKPAKNNRAVAKVHSRPVLDYNKEENEEIMENLMNRIVGKPGFGSDPLVESKVERIYNVKGF